MRKLGGFLALVSVLLLALPVVAQEEPGTIARIFHYTAKSGMQQEFEGALKQHSDWHRQQNDTRTFYVSQVVSGEDLGTYVLGRFGHQWADFDNPPIPSDVDEGYWLANVAPYVESVSGTFEAYLPKISRPRPEADTTPLHAVLTFRLHMGKEEEFLNALAKVHKAAEKTNWPVHYLCYVLVNGGAHPTFVLVLPMENWAAMKPPETPFEKMLEEAYGRAEAGAIMKAFEKAVKHETSELTRYRPDLSYVPAAQ